MGKQHKASKTTTSVTCSSPILLDVDLRSPCATRSISLLQNTKSNNSPNNNNNSDVNGVTTDNHVSTNTTTTGVTGDDVMHVLFGTERGSLHYRAYDDVHDSSYSKSLSLAYSKRCDESSAASGPIVDLIAVAVAVAARGTTSTSTSTSTTSTTLIALLVDDNKGSSGTASAALSGAYHIQFLILKNGNSNGSFLPLEPDHVLPRASSLVYHPVAGFVYAAGNTLSSLRLSDYFTTCARTSKNTQTHTPLNNIIHAHESISILYRTDLLSDSVRTGAHSLLLICQGRVAVVSVGNSFYAITGNNDNNNNNNNNNNSTTNRPSNSIATQRMSEITSTDATVTNLTHDRFPLNSRETNHNNASSSSSSDAEDNADEDDDDAFVRLDFNVDNNINTTDPYYSAMYSSNRQTLHHTTLTSPSNTIMWIMYFFLLRLWLEALMERDTGLMLFCLMVTALATRAAQRRREMEEEMARQRAERGELALPIGLQHMSFRAQLAHAMLESQRMQMMAQANGGIHSPESSSETNNGVSEEIQRTWKRWTYGSGGGGGGGSEETQQSKDNTRNHNDNNALSTPSRIQKAIMRLGSVGVGAGVGSSGYGTVSRMDQQEEEDNTCVKEEDVDLELGQNGNADAEHQHDITRSICLCEYEEEDEVTMLPCNHVYHEACVKEWTGQSQRCPLCNHDLMSMPMQDSSTSIVANNSASLETDPASVAVSI